MDREALEVLREAARIRTRKEPLERAVGRAVRKKGKDFAYYVSIMSELREAASTDKVSIDDELRLLVDEGKDDG